MRWQIGGRGPRFWKYLRDFNVTLDGERILRVTILDEERGFIERIVGEDGRYVRVPMWDGHMDFKRERLFGVVKLVRKDGKEWRRGLPNKNRKIVRQRRKALRFTKSVLKRGGISRPCADCGFHHLFKSERYGRMVHPYVVSDSV